MDKSRFDAAIDRLYEAAVQPEVWRDALDELADATNSFGVQVLHHRPEGASLHAASSRLDPVLQAFFAEGWHRNNPRELRARQRGVANEEVVLDGDLFTDEELDRERWQTEFLDRFGLRWFLSFALRELFEAAPFFMTFEREKSSPRFTREEAALLAATLPHFRRAFRMSQAVGAAAQSGMMDALTALNKAAILLDDLGQVVRLNEAAELLLGDGIVVTRGALRATVPSAARPLQALIDNVCWPGVASAKPSVDSIAIRRREGPPLIVQAAPLINTARDLFQRARALVLITPLHKTPEVGEGILKQAFALTNAEVRLAREIARGGGLPAAARALEVSPSTARSHLRAVFAKTNTHSQSELAVLLSRVGSGLVE